MSNNAAAAAAASSGASKETVRVLRGKGFLQPNTRAERAAVLNDDEEITAEDLESASQSRAATVKLSSTILQWRRSLQTAARALASSSSIAGGAGKSASDFTSPIPAEVKVVEFKPPETIAFRALHKRDGDLKFEWRDFDAAVGGVHQPKIIGVSGTDKEQEELRQQQQQQQQLSRRAGAVGHQKEKKMWLPHELDPADRAAFEALMLKWREEGRNAAAAAATGANSGGAAAAVVRGVRIRARDTDETSGGGSTSASATGASTDAATIDLDEIMRLAQEALLRG
jgi:hypothetical protein